jgi:hypoxanthine phosphoribosyltransferase
MKDNQPTRVVTIEEVMQEAMRCAWSLCQISAPVLYGVPRGGVVAALAVAKCLPWRTLITGDPSIATAIIDDVYETGATMVRFAKDFPNTPFAVLFDKREPQWANQWLVFPWESGRDH